MTNQYLIISSDQEIAYPNLLGKKGYVVVVVVIQVRNGCSKSRWSRRSNLQPVTLIREGLAPTSNERRAACATSGAGSN